VFNNIGKKIKSLATFVCILGVVLSITIGLGQMIVDDETFVSGLFVLLVGPVISWLSTLILYGFGELIVKVTNIERVLCSTNTTNSNIGAYTCPVCNMENDTSSPCERCGYIPTPQ